MKPVPLQIVVPTALAAVPAFFATLSFRNDMPMAEWFYHLEGSWLVPLSSLNLSFHEAGHWIFGILGIRFITILGGTLGQLFFPSVCIVHFLKQKSRAGVLFCLAWLGENFMEISWYMADAKVQALILISGMSGREGGGHDWGNMLGIMGLTDDCVGMAEVVHWAGLTLMLFPLAWVPVYLWGRYVGAGVSASG